MAKFSGAVGYGKDTEVAPGVWDFVITERHAYGDVVRNNLRFQGVDQISENLSVGNSISIVADAYARDNFFAMKYVEWAGEFWEIAEVQVQHPRLLLRLGGVYNGPRPAPSA
jgi:hypothetical protein